MITKNLVVAIVVLVVLLNGSDAQRWPMITVNSYGEIVLQSLTRANSFQFSPSQVYTGPSSGTASPSTATNLTAGVSVYTISPGSTVVSGHGVTLPPASTGAMVYLMSGDSVFVTYTVYSPSGSSINSNLGTDNRLPISSRVVICTSVSNSRWECAQGSVLNSRRRRVSTSSSLMLDASLSGSLVTVTVSDRIVNLPTCNDDAVGTYFQIVMTTCIFGDTMHLSPQLSDRMMSNTLNGGFGMALEGVPGQDIMYTTATSSNTIDLMVTCVASGRWSITGAGRATFTEGL